MMKSLKLLRLLTSILFKTIKILVLKPWGPLIPLTMFLVTAWLVTNQLGELLRYSLRILGVGTVFLAILLAVFIGLLRLKPSRVLHLWRWWIGLVCLLGSSVGFLAYFEVNYIGLNVPGTLGGSIGNSIIGTSHPLELIPSLLGALRIVAVFITACFIMYPKYTYRFIRVILRLINQVLGLLLRMSYPIIHWAARLIQLLATFSHRLTQTQPNTKVILHKKKDVAKQNEMPSEQFSMDLGDSGHDFTKKTVPSPKKSYVTQPAKKVDKTNHDIWHLPSLDLFEPGAGPAVITKEHEIMASRIEDALEEHGVQVTVAQIKPGPTVTLYGLSPGWVSRSGNKKNSGQDTRLREDRGDTISDNKTRVKVDSILAREKDLALALAVPSLRIQAPVPGESVVGIEVPNKKPLLVTTRSVMESKPFRQLQEKQSLCLALGQGSGGEPIVADLRQLPHLLIAGATGSGKSVCISAILSSLTSTTLPDQLRLLLIDPKRVELTPLNGLPHLIVPVIVDTDKVVPALKGIMREMFRRYRIFEALGTRNIEAYHLHPKREETMPYLVVAIDELADLMMAAPYDIEQTICRLAQLGRATGIHLIVATQRPSVDVVTGLIKANFPSRIGFAVASQVDSRTILDSVGADRLLGKGDMLFLSGNSPKPQRVQGAYLSDNEIQRLVESWKIQNGPELPYFDLEEPIEDSAEYINEEISKNTDDLLVKAKELATRYTHLSTSLLQRRLRIGYPRAARLMDTLEDIGVVIAGEPGKSREVTTKSSRDT